MLRRRWVAWARPPTWRTRVSSSALRPRAGSAAPRWSSTAACWPIRPGESGVTSADAHSVRPTATGDLTALVDVSRRLGGDPDLVLYGGGNTSIKTAERD